MRADSANGETHYRSPHHYWLSVSTDELRDALAEYELKMPEELADVIADLKDEIAGRERHGDRRLGGVKDMAYFH